MVAHKLVVPANVSGLMDAALLQLEHPCGLRGSLSAAGQVTCAHMLNVYLNIQTLPSMTAWRAVQKGSD